jgi:hypothetical protein
MLVHFRYAFPSCSPDPDHLTVLARPGFVETACHPFPRSRGQTVSNSTNLLRQAGGGGLAPLSVQERLVALYVADPELVGAARGEVALDEVVVGRWARTSADSAFLRVIGPESLLRAEPPDAVLRRLQTLQLELVGDEAVRSSNKPCLRASSARDVRDTTRPLTQWFEGCILRPMLIALGHFRSTVNFS